ncbi:MAG: 4-hydroxybenzoyl-CoA thioesterase, partial [Hoeflea sp.]|nr:4-hydroxybenzoyl-CoA thioesterase [Hoeflea sp.]
MVSNASYGCGKTRGNEPTRLDNMDASLSGHLADGGHQLMQRVYYEDTDFSGFVY